MKIHFQLTLAILLLCGSSMVVPGCSKNEFNPEDYVQSVLSGEYGKRKLWTLNTILNGDTIQTDGYVRFESKYQTEEADFRFVNIIPGDSNKEFKNIPLTPADNGLTFTIDYSRKAGDVHISGTVTLGEMTVNMTMSK